MRTKHLFVLIHIRKRVRLIPSKMLSAPVIFLLTVPRRCFFCGSFLLFVFRVILSCMFHTALWSPAGKGLTSWFSCDVFLYFRHFLIWCSGLGLVHVFDCMDPRHLSYTLLSKTVFEEGEPSSLKNSGCVSTFLAKLDNVLFIFSESDLLKHFFDLKTGSFCPVRFYFVRC